ncbi:DUF1652 domain-containing protein [Pseudomonas syringae]|nr:DUF1652 domain-containing protein [Pseudomonas syringae]MBI6740457.1 DUF1652 domain-containing protein [Pseudomonas syringae]MBI6748539.1 DUF1652 domain-containing protein [Pseudomonas syringae]MBI6753238.1 DUF1652 domain-containing protein [Pseudomonas syringae]MBI6762653.1 DUF1652 domain-containing protein [Pseudomonas syringae]
MNCQTNLRPCIEAACLPMKCVCVIAPDASMTIRVFDTNNEAEEQHHRFCRPDDAAHC